MNLLKWNLIFLSWNQYILDVMPIGRGQVELSKVTCESLDNTFVTFPKCVTTRGKGNRISWSVYAKLHEPIENMTIHAKLLRLVTKKYRPFLYEDTIDVCSFLRSSKRHVLWGMLYKMLAQNSNINHTCPFENALIVDNFVFDSKQFRVVPLPRGQYKMDTLLSVGDSPKIKIELICIKT